MRRVAMSVLMAAVLAAATPASAQSVVFGVARDGSGFLNEPVSIPVWADLSAAGGEKLGSYTLRVTFNPSVLYYNAFQERAGTFATPFINRDSASVGVLRIAAVSAAGGMGFLELGHLVFTPYDDTTTTITVTVQEASAAGTFTNLLPFVTTSNGVYCPARGRWGDTDSDGSANSRDALAILSHVVGKDPGVAFDMTLGDADGDGLTNTRDALILLSYAVGLEIPGQRAMLVAPGSCAVGGAHQISIRPDTLDLVIGQRTPLRVISRVGGTPVVLNGINWVVDDPRIGFVDPSSFEFVARDTGTTVLRAALGPGIQATVPAIVRARRGVWHVNGNVTRGSIALGTVRYPFWTPQQAFPVLQEGDTIRIAPGIVDYDTDFSDVAAHGFILIGDTLPDGTRPTLRAPDGCCSVAELYNYYYYAPPAGAPQTAAAATSARRRVEYHHLVMRNFDTPLYADGLSTLIVRNVRVVTGPNVYTYGFDVYGRPDTVDLMDVESVAQPAAEGGYLLYLYNGGSLVRMVNIMTEHLDGAIYISNGIDSLHVENSLFRYAGSDVFGLYGDEIPIGGLYIANNRIENYYRGLAGFEVHRATVMNNVWINGAAEALQLYAPYWTTPTGPVSYRVIGDSIRNPGQFSDWIEADDFDTLLVQDVYVSQDTSARYTYMYVWGRNATFRRTVIDGAQGEGFDVDAQTATLDTVTVRGCRTCAYGSVAAVDFTDFDNQPGARLTVRGGTFRRIGYGIYAVNSVDAPGHYLISGNTFDSLSYGIYAYVDSLTLASNTFNRVRSYGTYVFPSNDRVPFGYLIQQNVVRCDTTGAPYGLYLENAPMAFVGNYVEGCYRGIYPYNGTLNLWSLTFNGDSVFTNYPGAQQGLYLQGRWTPTLTGVRVRGGVTGIYLATTQATTVTIDSSAVSQTGTYGMFLSPVASTTITGVRNNVADNAGYGIYNVNTAGTRSFTLGRFVNNGLVGVLSTPSFDATMNWWGSASGPSSIPPADTVSGAVNTASFLTSDPANVPALAPPALGALTAAMGPAVASPAGPAPPAVRTDEKPREQVAREAREAARERMLEKRREAEARRRS